MKILLYISTMERGGAERVMSVLADEFFQKGHDVILLNDYGDHGVKGAYEVNREIKRIWLTDKNEGNFIAKNAMLMHKIRKVVREEKPDIMLAFLREPSIRMIFSTEGTKVKKYVSVRNDPNVDFVNEKRRAFFNWIYGKADGVIFQTREAMACYSDKVQKKAAVILNPVDRFFFCTKRKTETRNIVAMGRLDSVKNFHMLIDSFALIAGDFTDENLLIYGEGELRKELQTLIHEHGLEGRVLLPGVVDDAAEVLSSAKIFVLSSDHEGLPNALMEALAMGVPCISTDCPCGGPRELISSGENGMLVSTNNSAELAEAMRTLLQDADLRERLGLEAKERAKAFQTEEIVSQWENCFLT